MSAEKSEKDIEKKIEIEYSVIIMRDKDYKGTFNSIYRQMMDEGLV